MGNANCDLVTTGPQVDGARFTSTNQVTQLPSDAFWIRQGEQMQAHWDTYILYNTTPGSTCDPMAKPSPLTCERCDLALSKTNPAECRSLFEIASYLTVLDFAGFSSQSTPANLASAQYMGALATHVLSFTPSENSLLQLQAFYGSPNAQLIVETKAFVITSGMGKTVTYPLAPLPQSGPAVGNAVFFSGSIAKGVPVTAVSDNYSSTLQIGKVRVLKGKPDTDPSSGQFRLSADSTVLQPSRIVLIPAFPANGTVYGSDRTRCYASYGPQTMDGDLDLTRCRFGLGNPSTQFLGATPGFLSLDTQILTWVAEFKPSDGGVLPPMLNSDEVVAIEFTIQ